MCSKSKRHRRIKTHSDAVLYYIQRMDIEMLDFLLKPDRTYQKLNKPVFIEKLRDAFRDFKKAGDTFLLRRKGYCNSHRCNFKAKGFRFVGNHSGHYFNLIIAVQKDEVQDIFECLFLKNSPAMNPRGERVRINRTDLQDSKPDDQ